MTAYLLLSNSSVKNMIWGGNMNCPKCKAKIGIMKHEIILDTGVIHCLRCVMCGYWSQSYPTYNPNFSVKQEQAAM